MIIHEDVVSLVFVNQSDAVNDEMVVFAFRAVTSYFPTDSEFRVRAPPSVGVTSDPTKVVASVRANERTSFPDPAGGAGGPMARKSLNRRFGEYIAY
jgi:hypothetical protein